jgi:hypothetical protein
MEISRELLSAYLDEALDEAEASRVEQALRASESLRATLAQVLAERDRGEHSLGAIWRRERLTCAGRDTLREHLMNVLSEEEAAYLKFHLEVAGCPYCLANLEDLKQAGAGQGEGRRKRIYQAGASLLPSAGQGSRTGEGPASKG